MSKAVKDLMSIMMLPMMVGGYEYMSSIHVPSFTAGHSKYVPGNCPEGLTDEEKKRNKDIGEKRALKKSRKV